MQTYTQVNPNNLTFCFLGIFFGASIPVNQYENRSGYRSCTYWRVQVVCKKVQAHSSLEPLLQYNPNQTPLINQGSLLIILGVTEILCSFRLVPEVKTGNETPDSSRLEFLEKFWSNIFALPEAEYYTSGPLNRGGIEDLPLFKNTIGNFLK